MVLKIEVKYNFFLKGADYYKQPAPVYQKMRIIRCANLLMLGEDWHISKLAH